MSHAPAGTVKNSFDHFYLHSPVLFQKSEITHCRLELLRIGLFHLCKRHTKRTGIEAHQVDGLLDGNRIDFREKVFTKIQSVFLNLRSALDITLEHLVAHIVDSTGSDVGDDGDDSDSTHGHQRDNLVIIDEGFEWETPAHGEEVSLPGMADTIKIGYNNSDNAKYFNFASEKKPVLCIAPGEKKADLENIPAIRRKH